MNLRSLSSHAHSQWLTILLDESFGRLQEYASPRNVFRWPLKFVSLLRLKANLPRLLQHYSNGERRSLQKVAAWLNGDSHRLDIQPGSLGADCRAIYMVAGHLEGWAAFSDSANCDLSEMHEEEEIECVNELASYSSIDLVRVTEEAYLLLANGSAEEVAGFLNEHVKHLPILGNADGE